MSFSTSFPPVMVVPLGFTAGRSTGFKGGAGIWVDVSSDGSTAISNIAGYYRGQAAVPSGRGQTAPGAAGLRCGDVICHIESSGGSVPGRISWHAITATSAQVSNATPLPSSAFSQAWDATPGST